MREGREQDVWQTLFGEGGGRARGAESVPARAACFPPPLPRVHHRSLGVLAVSLPRLRAARRRRRH